MSPLQPRQHSTTTMRRQRRSWPGVALACLLAPWACSAPDAPSSNTPATPSLTASSAPEGGPSHMHTLRVSASDTMPTLALGGKIAYAEDRFSMISSPLQGRVTDVRVKLGDSVSLGQILLVVDSPDIAQAYSDFIKEHSDLAFAQRSYDLAVELYKVQAIPLKDYKQAENDLVKATAEFRRLRERLLSLKVPAHELDKPIEDQHVQSRFELRSPLAGTVVDRQVTPGQMVGGDPSQVLFTIADLDTLQVVADVYERDLGLIAVGQVATATVESAPGLTFPAPIALVGDVVDPSTRTVKIRAWVNNESRKLKPEMFARLAIPVGSQLPVIAVPSEAIVEAEGHQYVYVMDRPDHYEKREVHVQKLGDHRMRVLAGLQEGDTILSKGAVLLKSMAGQG